MSPEISEISELKQQWFRLSERIVMLKRIVWGAQKGRLVANGSKKLRCFFIIHRVPTNKKGTNMKDGPYYILGCGLLWAQKVLQVAVRCLDVSGPMMLLSCHC